MAPFRNRDRSNRSGRGQIEHNVLEGLPIHQYREVEITVGANTGENAPADKGAWPELPMPRDSHMLPEHSQQLLRAARSGRLYKPPAPPEDDNEMKDEEEETKEVKIGFTIKKYVKVARHLEAAEPEYLAKRRKGLPSQYAINGEAQPALRETKVKKLDAEGNATVYKVLVPEGQAVEGEVQPTDEATEAAPATAAPGTVVEGVGVVNAQGVVVAGDILQQTPPRRRHPPPKKKRTGPGRGRRRVLFAEGAGERGIPAPVAGGDTLSVPRVKLEGGSAEPSDGDTPMAETGEHDEEGSGEDGSDDDEHDGEHTPTAPTSVPNLATAEKKSLEAAASADPAAVISELDIQPSVKNELPEPSGSGAPRDRSSSPELPLSAMSHSRQNSLNQLPTSTTSNEPEGEPMSVDGPSEAGAESVAEPAPVPVTLANPGSTVAPTIESAADAEPVPATSSEIPSAPPSEADDLMASLDRHLEKNNEDIAGA